MCSPPAARSSRRTSSPPTLGITVVGTTVLMELEALGGRALVGDVHAVFTA